MREAEIEVNGHKMKAWVNDNGDYVGNAEFAGRLAEMGIEPELASPNNRVCSIGFCAKENKWYGWSHRAIYGFTIGSEVKQGDCAYSPTDKEDFLNDMVRFWTEDSHENVTGEHSERDGEAGVYVSWTYSNTIPNEQLRSKVSGVFSRYPDTRGRGEWTAKTMEDAKQMAIDFANGVN